ncbi:uncharacterized protein HMPREF1541_04184 [Cyphellophora europaea CBS 101466]|uniref:Dolichyl-diphosphooligosaccharide--protein glycosyltransferase subunit OST2 n=1 Tax=Cyphellophora europaea (strain CBS 101466) TaxID=1220924 RepID=W2S2F9_CYPE1|nr:uncharacterized protein HMPREF1541_04184 [Cyphellophora europaea CBS 101466]ETN42243.1 hypothetical protein HMPREF1541_04184 [Cyphellophora europaea CBS 101466]
MAKKPASQPQAAKPAPTTPAKSPAAVARPTPTASTSAPSAKVTAKELSPRSSPQEIAVHVWNRYIQDTPSRTLFLDVFLLYIALNGAVQFIYCIIGGNYPFNAFLSGFSAAVGQFVLTISLRMQTSERPPSGASSTAKKTSARTVDGVTGELVEEKGESKISSERAFADFVFGSLILHGFCVNFIN